MGWSEGVAMSLLFYLVLFIATCSFGWCSRNEPLIRR